jgi:ferritin-like metal-binding protein YciE
MREKPTEELLEFFNVGAAQKVERYEITSYESLIDMADKLGLTEAVGLLEENLREEEEAFNKLRAIASEFDVTDQAEELEDSDADAEEEHATSRR